MFSMAQAIIFATGDPQKWDQIFQSPVIDGKAMLRSSSRKRNELDNMIGKSKSLSYKDLCRKYRNIFRLAGCDRGNYLGIFNFFETFGGLSHYREY
jgi:hypothetical protein